MHQPLQDIKVVDLSRILAGPLCTMILADLGADVLKIEAPAGDDTRTWGPPFRDGMAAYFATINRNKKSQVLDLKTQKDQKILRRHLASADVLVENYLPESARRLGLGPEQLRKEFPNLIHCSITGFGHKTAWKDVPGYDFVIQAMSGLMAITGEENGAPMKVGVALTDVITGLYAAIGIVSQLAAKKRAYAHVDVSLWQSTLSSLVNVGQAHLMTGVDAKRYGNGHPNIVPYQSFATGDGYLVVAIGNDEQFRKFCRIMKREELGRDERFATNPKRVENRAVLVPIIAEALRQRPRKEWQDLLTQEGIPHGPVQSVAEAFHFARQIDPSAVIHDESGLAMVRSPLVPDQESPKPPPRLGD